MEKLEESIKRLEDENSKLFEELKRKKVKLSSMMKELQEKNAELSERSRDLSDSVNYAKRIQLAIMPPRHEVNKMMEESFIMYLPKDVVSGDFYFVEKIDDQVIFAVVDCTGHGVPGALMSVVGFNCLDQAITKDRMTRPCDILSFLDEGVNATLRQTADASGVKDGMDLGLCTFDVVTNVLQYSGAYNPAYIVTKSDRLEVIREREIDVLHPRVVGSKAEKEAVAELASVGGSKNGAHGARAWLGGRETVSFEPSISLDGRHLFEIKADKLPIGVNLDGVVDIYTNNTVQLAPGDTVYLFSDGYADQFGGANCKKFKYHRLKQMLVSIQDKTMIAQKRILVKSFNHWKGEEDQIDDVLIMGLRVV
ncbi:MAG: SpoIIE family protein phosphatase [Flavobacteriales bacterium]|nr:SpoIIE family protein phosphatase [Flavobacteriales bacterium]